MHPGSSAPSKILRNHGPAICCSAVHGTKPSFCRLGACWSHKQPNEGHESEDSKETGGENTVDDESEEAGTADQKNDEDDKQ